MHPPQQLAIANRLLASLSADDFASLRPHLEPVSLDTRKVLIEPNTPIAHVYFPEAGMSSVTNNGSGGKIEVGVVGREGMVGLPIVLGIDRTPYEHFMQIAGHGWRIAVQELEQAMAQSSSLHRHLLRYVQASHVQVSETAFANANSDVEARLARWLLMCHDRVEDDDIPLTHEFIAMMLGVRRPGVTVALHVLEGMQVIRAKRGLITVLDREKLEELANEAYGLSETEYTRLMRTESRDMPRYFLHLKYPSPENGFARDEEGDDLEDASALRQHVVDTAHDLMKGARLKVIPNWLRCSFEMTDEVSTVVLTLPFSEAVK